MLPCCSPAGIVWNMFQQLVIWGPYCDHDDCEQWCWASSGHGVLVSGAETQNIGHLLVSTHPHHLSCDPPSALNTHWSSDVSSLCCFIVKNIRIVETSSRISAPSFVLSGWHLQYQINLCNVNISGRSHISAITHHWSTELAILSEWVWIITIVTT